MFATTLYHAYVVELMLPRVLPVAVLERVVRGVASRRGAPSKRRMTRVRSQAPKLDADTLVFQHRRAGLAAVDNAAHD